MKKIFFKTLVITLVISAILGISIILLDMWNEVTLKVLESTATIFCFSIPGLCASTIYEKQKYKKVSLLGISSCLLSTLYCLLLIWEIIPSNGEYDIIYKLLLTFLLLSFSLGHICLLLLVTSDEKKVLYYRNATIILSTIMDALLLIILYFEVEVNWKIIAILAILIALGTIVTPILNKLYKKNTKLDNKVKKIYIAHSKGIDYVNELYKPLKGADFLKEYELILPHEKSKNSSNTRDFYKDIDILIAEVSKPATGLGIELGWAFDDNTKIYCIHKEKIIISNSIKAITENIYEYKDTENMLNIIKSIIN